MRIKNLIKSSMIGSIYKDIRYFYYKSLSSKQVINRRFISKNNRKPNLQNPSTFNEKLQWLKLNWYSPNAVKCADKYEVRNYVKEKIGDQYLNELYGVYNSVDEINIDQLPKAFVLKATHGSGSILICKDKNKEDWNKNFKMMRKWLKRNIYWYTREWVYKDIQPRIICEKYLEEIDTKELTDYKLYCFNGKPTYCQVIKGRNSKKTIDFFDTNWNHMGFNGLQRAPHYPQEIPKPEKYEKMLKLAKKLSEDFPFVRVDLYYVNQKIYFGELTFFPMSGFGAFNPIEWDKKMGDLLELPK
ncbi:glycosyl transferase [Compostibacillus humi]|uniref:Glycosyl transferase n=1 Tax=Compostibacillus humi TaxID=1245525 RepID=A0A8J2TLE7_9BACI|nr:ATP-grasp fold amidoligase family protein [Compostibacillus humi]GFZ79957.1 glycosyl transferase [Compostibacillus humi]